MTPRWVFVPAGLGAVGTMTANGQATVGSRPSRTPVSSRGTICPRTLNSPLTAGGAVGTSVTSGPATISWRATGGSAYQSRPTGSRIARVILSPQRRSPEASAVCSRSAASEASSPAEAAICWAVADT